MNLVKSSLKIQKLNHDPNEDWTASTSKAYYYKEDLFYIYPQRINPFSKLPTTLSNLSTVQMVR